MRKHTLEYIKQYFEERGCELLEKEYIDSKSKLRYRCDCGNISEIILYKFQQGRRCNNCSTRRRYDFDYVRNYFKQQKCELLENSYKNLISKLEYRCHCGKISKITFRDFRDGKRCKNCGIQKSSETRKHTFRYVQDYFKQQKCELLESSYTGNKRKIKFLCICGKKGITSFSNFQKGVRCHHCLKNRRTETMIQKYGVPFFTGSGYSKESQKLFNIIYDKLDKTHKAKTYYATLNKEFGVNHLGRWFSFDYVNSNCKKVIEYNGRAWHPKPNLKDEETGWFALDKNKTAREARDYERIKYTAIKKRGYQILTVWDYELHTDIDILVKKCLDFLLS